MEIAAFEEVLQEEKPWIENVRSLGLNATNRAIDKIEQWIDANQKALKWIVTIKADMQDPSYQQVKQQVIGEIKQLDRNSETFGLITTPPAELVRQESDAIRSALLGYNSQNPDHKVAFDRWDALMRKLKKLGDAHQEVLPLMKALCEDLGVKGASRGGGPSMR